MPKFNFKETVIESLRRTDPKRIFARRSDGSPITAAEMANMVEQESVEGVQLLEDVVSASMRLLRVRNGK